MKKLVSKSLCWVLICAMVLAQILIPVPAQATLPVREADTNIQNGTTLHCWNWSYANIIDNLPTIAAQGFTSIQVSPIQKAKQPTMGSPVNDWWTFYQPAEFAIDNTGVNAMGTKADFMNLCETAHEYGIYVIVDVVANHMAADYNYSRSPAIIDDIRNDDSCWHNRNSNINNYSSRENITQYDLDSVLDLNTGSKKVQNYVLNYLKELIDAGADGFRFDAVKHIETPDDNASIASDFWPTVIYGAEDYAESKGLDLYCYGELLDHPDDVNGVPDSAYSKYYSITDNVWGNNVRDNVIGSGNASNFGGTYHKNASADQLVIWAESHDTYAGGASKGVSEANINKTWALVAARANAMSLYLTRTAGFTPPNALGEAYLSGWNVAEVAAVNKFHKAFIGQSEYVANSGNIAYVERGTSGAVLVNVSGNGTSVNVTANRLANGTYKDQISGNTFKVSGGKITGNIGSSGIAVIYNVASCSHSSHYIAGLCTTCGASVSHSYSGGVCKCGKTKPVTSGCTHTDHRYNGVCRGCGTNVGHSYQNNICTVCGVEKPVDTFDYYLVGFINGSNVNEIKEEYRFKDGKLTLNSSSDAWISIRTYNGIFYQTSPDQQYNDTVILRNASMSGGSNAQMRVPGGKTVTLQLQSNYNGTYTLSYAEGGIVAPEVPSGNANDYYLVGYINGANYGCEEDYSNLGNYKFTDGKLTATFQQDSYVFVKTGDNSKWLLAESYCQDTTCTFSEGKSEKMFVPGGVELTFTLTKNSNGSVTVSYSTAGSTDPVDPVTTKTIYVDVTGFGWSKVNVYTWDAKGNATTGIWPGSAMTKVSGNIYSYEVPSNAVNIIFNDGFNQTNDLTIPTDGKDLYNYKQNSWSIYETECSHNYTSKVTLAASCTQNGLRTYTCTLCGLSYPESIPATGHSYSGGKCTSCGEADPNYDQPETTYCLVGYINGADHGCENDWENLGDYQFVNGKLTAKFNEDSYVFIKTSDNAKWLLADSYCTDTTCTFSEGKSEKMLIPGGVELTFTLTENADGSVTLSYAKAGNDEPVVSPSKVPTLTLKAPTLEFKDMITVNAFYTAENIDDVVEMGMLTYSTNVSTANIETAEHVTPGAQFEQSSGRYFSSSHGIHAKYLGDTVYLAIYAKLADGTYAYSKVAPYSAVQYATSQLKNSTDTKLKQLVAAMLNYGAEAQLYFGHNTGSLANASLTAAQKALPAAYSSGMVGSVPTASTAKQGNFANNQGFASRKPAISFEGAFCINYFFTPNYAPASGITLYYWDAADYNAASVLTTANATGSIKLEGSGTGEYRGDITGISAKALADAVYVAAVYESSGTTWTSGVLGYSIGAYCSNQASAGGTISGLAKATAVYGYHAKQYFG